MDNQSVNEAIEILINNFTNHPSCASSSSSASSSSANGLKQLQKQQLTVFEMLAEFWQLKSNGNLSNSHSNNATEDDNEIVVEKSPTTNIESDDDTVVYEFLESPSPPFVCFVTLPNGACFATFQYAATKMEAKKNAALIALMNSIFNEHPLRRINEEFIAKSVESGVQTVVETATSKTTSENSTTTSAATATTSSSSSCSLSLELYRKLLEMCLNRTMLDFKQMMTVFQLLQWNGSLQAMRERNCLLDEVITTYKNFKIDDKIRSQMAVDWVAREMEHSGIIVKQLDKVNGEIEETRLAGQEMRFLKEKREILLLACYQFDVEVNSN